MFRCDLLTQENANRGALRTLLRIAPDVYLPRAVCQSRHIWRAKVKINALHIALIRIPLLAVLVFATAARASFTEKVIKIGVLNDQSGPYADPTGQGSVIAAKMAVEDFGGKVEGTPIEVIFADHQNKPDIGSNVSRQWYDVDHVDAIVDVPTSSV